MAGDVDCGWRAATGGVVGGNGSPGFNFNNGGDLGNIADMSAEAAALSHALQTTRAASR